MIESTEVLGKETGAFITAGAFVRIYGKIKTASVSMVVLAYTKSQFLISQSRSQSHTTDIPK